MGILSYFQDRRVRESAISGAEMGTALPATSEPALPTTPEPAAPESTQWDGAPAFVRRWVRRLALAFVALVLIGAIFGEDERGSVPTTPPTATEPVSTPAGKPGHGDRAGHGRESLRKAPH